MIIELHVIQNFVPSNLNRDDTGAPKDCEFGGVRRARISSQCMKRAMRERFKEGDLLPSEHLAIRTKRLVERIGTSLVAQGKDETQARMVAEAALKAVGVGIDTKNKKEVLTDVLLFLGRSEIEAIAALCLESWDELLAAAEVPPVEGVTQSRKDARKSAQAAVPPALKKAIEDCLDGGKAADLALFGRMLAVLPEKNKDAASQVAHAISTHKVGVEFDFYTAVDDLKPDDNAGADMLGTIEFNSACFYRYQNVDTTQLAANLGDDLELARQTVNAFLQAAITAVPTGKQNSMAAHNPPCFVFAVVRDTGAWNLANAFARPVWTGPNGDLPAESIARLDTHWGELTTMYGARGIRATFAVTLGDVNLHSLTAARVDSVDALVAGVLGQIDGNQQGKVA